MKKLVLSKERKTELNNISLNIEFLVISVIQGMALQMLAGSALPVFSEYKTEYWSYAICAFILILIFWSQSIIHALSFIDWPIDLIHTFLYFLTSFIEVLTFTHITSPLKWFIFGLFFIIVSGILYFYDFLIIKRHKHEFYQTIEGKELYEHIYKHHMIEMVILVPAAILFNSTAIYLLYSNPTIFIQKHFHIVLAGIQCLFGLILLIFSVYSFKTRSELISRKS